ncbi:MAG TPA: SHOCT domain-containing protein [Solirubrobacteraceae bacterium]|jgi:uncharacterized protein YukE
MGFFKTAKDVKNLTQHHGGMPSIRGAFKDVAALADDRGEGEVLKNGVACKGIVKGFAEPVPGDKFAMHVPIEVHGAGGAAPYTVDYVFPTTRMKAAITVGMEVPVKVLPDQPERIAVQWDAQQASIAAAGGDMAAVMGGMQATYGGVADQAMRNAQANAAAEDPVKKIEKLTQMRDSGLITAEEFDAKKKEILEAM